MAPTTTTASPSTSVSEASSSTNTSAQPNVVQTTEIENSGEVKEVPKKAAVLFLTPEIASYFIAGGVAGATSRTVVSPLERLKIIQQVQPKNASSSYKGVWSSLVRMWREEGFKGFMRGNGINCLRIVPYSAVQFTTYEQIKKWFMKHGSRELDTPKRLAAGALAGITSVCSTYPLDLVRSRLSIATASIELAAATPSGMSAGVTAGASAGAASGVSTIPSVKPVGLTSGYHTASGTTGTIASVTASASHQSASAKQPVLKALYTPRELTVWGMTLKVMREEGGVRGLYRGLVTTAVGVAPYVGINFAAYEALRGIITPPGKGNVGRKLTCGALAGSISQTLTYPFDVLRRKMQVTGMQGGQKYSGAVDALRSILRVEGVSGLYRGLWPNLLKVAPSIATSFFTYELVKDVLVGR